MTVSTKLVLLVACPSLTRKVMVAVPLWPGAGVTVAVRLVPLPPNTTLALGTRVGLEELAVSTRLFTAVSASLTVKASGPVEVPAEIV